MWTDADKPGAVVLVNGLFKANAVIYDRRLSASRGRDVAQTDQGLILDGALMFRPAPLSFLSSPTISPPHPLPLLQIAWALLARNVETAHLVVKRSLHGKKRCSLCAGGTVNGLSGRCFPPGGQASIVHQYSNAPTPHHYHPSTPAPSGG